MIPVPEWPGPDAGADGDAEGAPDEPDGRPRVMPDVVMLSVTRCRAAFVRRCVSDGESGQSKCDPDGGKE